MLMDHTTRPDTSRYSTVRTSKQQTDALSSPSPPRVCPLKLISSLVISVGEGLREQGERDVLVTLTAFRMIVDVQLKSKTDVPELHDAPVMPRDASNAIMLHLALHQYTAYHNKGGC